MQTIQNLVIHKETLSLEFVETIQKRYEIITRKVIIRHTPGYYPFIVEFYRLGESKPYRIQKKVSKEHILLAQQLADIHHEQSMQS
jgi:hypothetical protein